MTQTVIEVFADIVCPFTHVGLRRLADRRAELGRDDVKLLVRALPLEVINGQPMEPEPVATKIAALRDQVSPDLFAGFDPARFPATSLPALALSNAAYRRDLTTGEAVALRLRRLVFDEGVDVSDTGVLAGLTEEYHLDVTVASDGLADDTAAVLDDLEESKQRGVIGSPHFFTPDGASLFCPSLELTRTGDHLDISIDVQRFEQLVASSFG